MTLWVGCFPTWFRYLTHYRVDPRQWTDCRLHLFLFYFWRNYSSTLLVLMSLEKCFAVYFPFKSKTICTVRTAKWVTGIAGILLAAYSALNFFGLKPRILPSGRYYCPYVGAYKIYLNAIDSVLYSFGPFILMFITNFAIAFKFIEAKCKNRLNASTESTNQAFAKSATRGTAMVVTVSVTFLVLTTPTAVYSILFNWYELNLFPFYKVFMNLTQYLNHSINGVLYCIVGSRFRIELFNLFCKKFKT